MKLYKIIILIVLILGLFALFYFWGLPIYEEKFKKQEIPIANVQINVPREEVKAPKAKEDLIKYIEENINDLAGFLPQDRPAWHVLRLGFVDGENVYADFEDGHSLSRILIRCKNEEEFFCRNIAREEVENFKWKVTEGEDAFSGREVSYYEKDEKGIWQFVFTSSQKKLFPISRDALLEIQQTADRGYLKWRLDPFSVLRLDTKGDFNFDPDGDEFEVVTEDKKEGKIIYRIKRQNEIWDAVLIQPVKRGDGGIWVIESMDKVG